MTTLIEFKGMTAVDVFFANVKKLMQDKKISQRQLARLMGCKHPSICRMFSEKQNVSIDRIEKIAFALDVPIQELFDKAKVPITKNSGKLKIGA